MGTLLPIQSLILGVFENETLLTKDFIMNVSYLKSYDNKDKEKVLNIFVNHNVLTYSLQSCENSDKLDIVYELNLDLEFISNTLISEYFNISDLPLQLKENRNNTLAHERKDIIKTIINSNLKRGNYNYQELLIICKKNNIFEVKE